MSTIISIILWVLSIGIFYFYIDPQYSGDEAKNINGIKQLSEIKSKIELKTDKIRMIEKKKEKLNSQLNRISSDYSDKVEKINRLIPRNIENARLINYVNNVRSHTDVSGMTNIQLMTNNPNKKGAKKKGEIKIQETKDYNSVNLSFHITSNYKGFKDFLDELYHSLRLVDIVSVNFKSANSNKKNNQDAENQVDLYDIDIVIRTYWLNNNNK